VNRFWFPKEHLSQQVYHIYITFRWWWHIFYKYATKNWPWGAL